MNPSHADIAARLADEEVPLRVIARALRTPAEDLREFLHDQVAAGRIIRIPRDDWHPYPRGATAPEKSLQRMEDEDFTRACRRAFKVTRLQASLLSLLIRRNEVPREVLHQRIQQSRKGPRIGEETDPKMVDVVVCHLRKRLKEHGSGLSIQTIWGDGYFMPSEHRQLAQQLLMSFLETTNGRSDNGREADPGTPSSAGDEPDTPPD